MRHVESSANRQLRRLIVPREVLQRIAREQCVDTQSRRLIMSQNRSQRAAKPERRRVVVLVLAVVVAMLVVAAAWRWTPLRDQINPSHIAEWIGEVHKSPFALLFIALLYVGASFLLIPNSALNAATILSLGSTVGLGFALTGSMASALTFYALGRRFGTKRLRKIAPHELERLQKAMEHGGALKVASIRMVPVAPFPVVNVVAGSVRVRPVPYTVGTFLGLLPGNLMLTVFGHQLRTVLRSPSPRDIVLLSFILLLAMLSAWWLHRRTLEA